MRWRRSSTGFSSNFVFCRRVDVYLRIDRDVRLKYRTDEAFIGWKLLSEALGVEGTVTAAQTKSITAIVPIFFKT